MNFDFGWLVSGFFVKLIHTSIMHSLLSLPFSAATNDSVSFDVNPHTGNKVTYNWTFGDGGETAVTENQISYTFKEAGIYSVFLLIWNKVSSANWTVRDSLATMCCVWPIYRNIQSVYIFFVYTGALPWKISDKYRFLLNISEIL